MDGRARMTLRVHSVQSEDVGDLDVTFEGRIDSAEDIGDGIVRVSGALCSGSRFVLVTNEAGLRD